MSKVFTIKFNEEYHKKLKSIVLILNDKTKLGKVRQVDAIEQAIDCLLKKLEK